METREFKARAEARAKAEAEAKAARERSRLEAQAQAKAGKAAAEARKVEEAAREAAARAPQALVKEVSAQAEAFRREAITSAWGVARGNGTGAPPRGGPGPLPAPAASNRQRKLTAVTEEPILWGAPASVGPADSSLGMLGMGQIGLASQLEAERLRMRASESSPSVPAAHSSPLAPPILPADLAVPTLPSIGGITTPSFDHASDATVATLRYLGRAGAMWASLAAAPCCPLRSVRAHGAALLAAGQQRCSWQPGWRWCVRLTGHEWYRQWGQGREQALVDLVNSLLWRAAENWSLYTPPNVPSRTPFNPFAMPFGFLSWPFIGRASSTFSFFTPTLFVFSKEGAEIDGLLACGLAADVFCVHSTFRRNH